MIPVESLQQTMAGLFGEHLGVRLVEATPERVVGEIAVSEHHCTTPGVLHGGAVMALADTLGAYATAIQLPAGARTTTLESKTNFFAAAKSGTTLRGECLPLHRGRSTMVWQTTLRTAEGTVAAIVTQTQIVLPPKLTPEQQLAQVFEGKRPAEIRAILARLELAAAAVYEGLAEAEPDAARRAEILAAAERERANAAVMARQLDEA